MDTTDARSNNLIFQQHTVTTVIAFAIASLLGQVWATESCQADQLDLLNGESRTGDVIRIEENRIHLLVDGIELQVPSEEVAKIHLGVVNNDQLVQTNGDEVPDQHRFAITLLDQSRIYSSHVQMQDEQLDVYLNEVLVTIPRPAIQQIRFAPEATLSAQEQMKLSESWAERNVANLSEDILVLRRAADQEDGTQSWSLSDYEGIVKRITESSVEFEFDDTDVAVDLNRIEGLLFFQSSSREPTEPVGQIQLADGSSLLAKSIDLEQGVLSCRTTSDVTCQIPVSDVIWIDFGYGRLVYLDSIAPTSVEWEPFIRSSTNVELLESLNRPRINRSYDDQPLSLRDESAEARNRVNDLSRDSLEQYYSHGIAVRSRTRMSYSIGGRFTEFSALAGIDPSMKPQGDIELIVQGDGEVLYRARILGSDEKPHTISCSIEGVERLTLIVDFGDQIDVADQLHICDPRLNK